MTPAQAQRRLDRADARLRMTGVSNLGMWAIYRKPQKHIYKLLDACQEWLSAWFAVEQAKKGKAR